MGSLALQKALRQRLTTFPAVTALVPAANVIDSHEAPEAFPAIVLGTDYVTAADLTWEHDHLDVVMTLHVWDRDPGLVGVKAIAEAIGSAIAEPLIVGGARVSVWFGSARFLRVKGDPAAAHAVVTLETTMRAP
jgi:hypothetical protein